jgi:hypothetical protein
MISCFLPPPFFFSVNGSYQLYHYLFSKRLVIIFSFLNWVSADFIPDGPF